MNSNGQEGQKRSYKIITIDVARKGARQHVIKSVEDGISSGLSTFKIRTQKANPPAYPSMCVPLAGVLDQFVRERGCTFLPTESVKSSTYLFQTFFLNPKTYNNELNRCDFLDKVWRFSSEDEFEIVSGIVRSIRGRMKLAPGVIESIELCLHEIMDNVLNHSLPESAGNETPIGYVMAQCHQENKTIAIAVHDNGQGILNSFNNSSYHPETAKQAIELALTKNVTNGRGAGRGMWMLSSIVSSSRGMIEISSESARYRLVHNDEGAEAKPVFSKIGSEIKGTTTVDFRLRADRPIDIGNALDGHIPVDLWLEDHEIDDHSIRFSVREESRGTGTRHAAKQFRNVVFNAIAQKGHRAILDFEGTGIISSSYADELLGKLIDDFGLVRFMERFQLCNVSDTNALIIDEALGTRVRATPTEPLALLR